MTRPTDLAPGTLAKEEEWKRWKEDIEDYVDVVTPGMKQILKVVGKTKDTVEKEFFTNHKERKGRQLGQVQKTVDLIEDQDKRRLPKHYYGSPER